MAAKRFSPSLMGIPEEDSSPQQPGNLGVYRGSVSSRRSSIGAVSLKRENSRRRDCTGCPGCSAATADLAPVYKDASSLPNSTCDACCTSTKQISIRKWLEDVPVIKASPDQVQQYKKVTERGKVKGKAPSVPSTSNVEPNKQSIDAAISCSEEKKLVNPESGYHDWLLNASSAFTKGKASLDLIQGHQAKVVPKASTKTVNVPTTPIPPCPPPPPLPPGENPDVINKTNIPKQEHKNTAGAPVVNKKLMDAVIKELVVQRGLETKAGLNEPISLNGISGSEQQSSSCDFESDSLERSAYMSRDMEKGMSTPSDYGDISQSSPSLSAALPLEEEMTMRNEIFNIRTGSKTISKLKYNKGTRNATPSSQDDHDYEIIVLNPDSKLAMKNKDMKLYSLPELLTRNADGYSLVSEVYVNDGYNFESASSSPSNRSSTSSNCSGPKIRYEEPDKKPGHLTIQVEDSPENYRQLPDNSDDFEPDTLDRKPSKTKSSSIIIEPIVCHKNNETFADSLERPVQILLRTTGSFKSDSVSQTELDDLAQVFAASPLTRAFGSLREIYEARTKNKVRHEAETASLVGSTRSFHSETDYNQTLSWRRRRHRSSNPIRYKDAVLLKPEVKQIKRQRSPTPPGLQNRIHKLKPPDVIPPLPPKMNSVYEDPPPPRPVYKVVKEATPPLPPRIIKPPLPPKNGPRRSTSQKRTVPDPARRPLPPLPDNGDSTLSSTSTVSHDIETMSTKSGASVDSNSSDYEAFDTIPYSGEEEEEANTLGKYVEHSLNKQFAYPNNNECKPILGNQFILKPVTSTVSKQFKRSNVSTQKKSEEDKKCEVTGDDVLKEMKLTFSAKKHNSKGLVNHLRDKRSTESVKKTWRKMVEKSSLGHVHKPEDSGYLSTDSNESNRHTPRRVLEHSRVQGSSQGHGSVSETDESLCDGASESGGESIATDSFFFGSFRKLSTCDVITESVDSGVGSDLVRAITNPGVEDSVLSSSDSENVSFVTVLHPASGRRNAMRC